MLTAEDLNRSVETLPRIDGSKEFQAFIPFENFSPSADFMLF